MCTSYLCIDTKLLLIIFLDSTYLPLDQRGEFQCQAIHKEFLLQRRPSQGQTANVFAHKKGYMDKNPTLMRSSNAYF